MNALDAYREAWPGGGVSRLADKAIYYLEAENKRAWGERDHFNEVLQQRNTELREVKEELEANREDLQIMLEERNAAMYRQGVAQGKLDVFVDAAMILKEMFGT